MEIFSVFVLGCFLGLGLWCAEIPTRDQVKSSLDARFLQRQEVLKALAESRPGSHFKPIVFSVGRSFCGFRHLNGLVRCRVEISKNHEEAKVYPVVLKEIGPGDWQILSIAWKS